MRGRVIPYSAEEMAWLEAHRTMAAAAWHADFVARFGRTDVTVGHLHALRQRKGWKTGRTGHFAAGHRPHNLGRRCPLGTGGHHPNAVATYFKPGERRGRAAETWKPIGTERITSEGYVERKVHDGLPMQARWQPVHRLRWVEAHGPIPAGHALKCLSGDKADTRPENWTCLPRGVLVRLNRGRHGQNIPYDAVAPDLKATVLAVATLKHAAFARRGEA